MKLFPYQEAGVRYLQSGNRRLLCDDPGLGKTAQALAALPSRVPVLVVTTKAMKEVWAQEVARWRPDFVPVILQGKGSLRWPEPGQVLITNYDILGDMEVSPSAGTHLILDEVHNAKNPYAARTGYVRELRIAALRVGGAVWGLTGTPLKDKPPDLWGTLTTLDLARDVFGSYPNFVRLFRGFKTHYGMRWGVPSPDVPGLLNAHVLGRKRTDVLPDLPTKIYDTFPVHIDHAVVPQVRDTKDGKNPDLSRARAVLAIEKAKAALPYLREVASSEPLIVFTYHRQAAEILAEGLGVVAAVGGDSSRGVADFLDSKADVLVGTIGSVGVGLTLVRASITVFIDRSWSPADNIQAEDRICRIGQTRGCRIIDVVSDHPVDTIVYRTVERKEEIEQASVGAAKDSNRR